MALAFAVGSTCFLVGPFPGYAHLVGGRADAVTFFVGSIFFTAGGALQTVLARPARHEHGAGRAAWWTATIQSAGTVCFNVSTFLALRTALDDPSYDRLVWRPDAFGSICFLVSGAIAYRASPRHGRRPAREGPGWWQPGVNLLGCVFFGISAIAGFVVPSTGSVLDLAAANWNTALGAACFLACAIGVLVRARAVQPRGGSRPRRPAVRSRRRPAAGALTGPAGPGTHPGATRAAHGDAPGDHPDPGGSP
jgi:hypothetical protein